MTDLYDSDEDLTKIINKKINKKDLKKDLKKDIKKDINKIINKEDDVSPSEMINKITENLYELETILQEKENEEILKSIYNMLNKKNIEPKEEQCSIQ